MRAARSRWAVVLCARCAFYRRNQRRNWWQRFGVRGIRSGGMKKKEKACHLLMAGPLKDMKKPVANEKSYCATFRDAVIVP